MKPRVLRSDIGNGIETLVPYGVSADVTAYARRLKAALAKVAREHQKRRSKREK
jgi:hypothetical protein